MSENFEQLLEESLKNAVMQTGAVIMAEVVDVNGDYVIVNAGLKSESEIPATQFRDADGSVSIKVGDHVEVAIEALEDGFDNTTVGSYTAKDIERFKEFLSDAFEPDDEILLVYLPEQGTLLYKNGEIRGSFAGLPFKQALFGIWLGDKPAQESLKKQMLGL